MIHFSFLDGKHPACFPAGRIERKAPTGILKTNKQAAA
jgi:hypothetical protein